MAIDFPPSPIVGQIYPPTPQAGVPTYTWDGEKWVAGNTAISGSHVLKAGDTMTGPLVLSGEPTLALHAATKQYVRTRYDVAGFSGYDIQVPAGTVGAKFFGNLNTASASVITPYLQISVAAGVFLTTGYMVSGFYNASPAATVGIVNNAAGYPGILLGSHQNTGASHTFDGQIVLKQTGGVLYTSAVNYTAYAIDGSVTHGFYRTYIVNAATSVLAIRLTPNTALTWAADSYIVMEWI